MGNNAVVDESRIFWRAPSEDSGPDESTRIIEPGAEPEPSRAPSPLSLKEQFLASYEGIRKWVERPDRDGVGVFALDGSLRGAAYLVAKPDGISTAILGRHSKADLRLSDERLSLRHLAVIVLPRSASSRDVRYRLMDLRSATAFLDERGTRLQAIEANGPAFVRCGRFWLLFLPLTSTPTKWPDDAEEAWGRIPDRLFLDEVPTEPKPEGWEEESDRAWEVEALPSLSEPPTLIHNVPGPQMAVHELLDSNESELGELEISSRRGVARVRLGEAAARAGVLLGRSRRCDAGRVLSDRSISRVHLLIILVGGKLYAIDTASYNGTWANEALERATLLDDGQPLSLAEVATVSWRRTRSSTESAG